MGRSRKVIGIDLGVNSFKIVEASINGSTIEVYNLDKNKFTCDPYDINNVFNLLESYLKDLGVQKKEIILSMSRPEILDLKVEQLSEQVSLEQMIQDIKEKIGIQNSIEWLEDSVVMNIKDLKIIFYGRCQKIISQSLDDKIKNTKNEFLALDFPELAIGRVLNFQLENKMTPSVVGVIDIGMNFTRINIYYNGILILPREITLGGQAFTQVWCDKKSIPFDESEKLKLESNGLKDNFFENQQAQKESTFSKVESNPWDFTESNYNETEYNPFQQSQSPFIDPSNEKGDFKAYNPFSANTTEVKFTEPKTYQSNPFHQSAYSFVGSEDKENELENYWIDLLEELTREIKRSLDYAQSLNYLVEKLYLTGGGGLINGLDIYLSKALHIDCQKLNPFNKIKVKLKNLEQEEYLKNPQEFSVAIGNILHTIY